MMMMMMMIMMMMNLLLLLLLLLLLFSGIDDMGLVEIDGADDEYDGSCSESMVACS